LRLLLTDEPLAVHFDFHLQGVSYIDPLPTVVYFPELRQIAPHLWEFQHVKLQVEATIFFGLSQLSFCDCEVEAKDWTTVRKLKRLCIKSHPPRKISGDLLLQIQHQQTLDDQFCLEEIRIVGDTANNVIPALAKNRTSKLVLSRTGYKLVNDIVGKLQPGSGPSEITVEAEAILYLVPSAWFDCLRCNRVKTYTANFRVCNSGTVACFCWSLAQSRSLESIKISFFEPEDVNEHWGAIFDALTSMPTLKKLTLEVGDDEDAIHFDECNWVRILQRHLLQNVRLDIVTEPFHPILDKLNRENRTLRRMESVDHLSLTTVLQAGCTHRVLYRILRSRTDELPCSL